MARYPQPLCENRVRQSGLKLGVSWVLVWNWGRRESWFENWGCRESWFETGCVIGPGLKLDVS